MTAGIYKITNKITNQVYFGSSAYIEKCLISHKSKLLRNIHDNKFLQYSFNKYGKASFVFELMEKVEKQRDLLLEREQYYLDLYFDNGKTCFNLNPEAESSLGRRYSEATRQKLKNTAPRGENHWAWGHKLSQKTKKKISNANKGKKFTDEHKKNLSKSHQGKSWGMHTNSTKKKLSLQKTGQKNPMWNMKGAKHPCSIEIIQMDLNENVIEVFYSLMDAQKKTGVSFKTISLCVNGKQKTSGGYKWKKKN